MPKAGLAITNVAFSDDLLNGFELPLKSNYKVGFVFGAAFEIGINDHFAVQPELLFQQKGFVWKGDINNESLKASFSLNYLELPLLLKGKFGIFHVNVGPSIGYAIGGNYKSEYTTSQGDTDKQSGKVKFGEEPNNNSDDVVYFNNALDLGVQIGSGIKAGPVVIDLRFGLGLSNLFDEDDGVDFDMKSKNRSIQLTVGFPILLGAK
jgi:hypothetical protein